MKSRNLSLASVCGAAVLVTGVLFSAPLVSAPLGLRAQAQSASQAELLQTTVAQYCVTCHNDRSRRGELSFEGLDLSDVGQHAAIQERILGQLRIRRMPPVDRPRPPEETYEVLTAWLASEIDRFAAANPNPGRTEAFHRLNRAEYANAVRDLLALDVDVEALLPADDIDANGFDNMADVLTVSPALMERYLSAARKTARLAVGEAPLGPAGEI